MIYISKLWTVCSRPGRGAVFLVVSGESSKTKRPNKPQMAHGEYDDDQAVLPREGYDRDLTRDSLAPHLAGDKPWEPFNCYK